MESAKKDSRWDKSGRIVEEINKLEPGVSISPTALAKKSKVHFTKLTDDLDTVDTYKDANFDTIRDPNDGKIKFIIKKEPDLLSMRREISLIKESVDELKHLVKKK